MILKKLFRKKKQQITEKENQNMEVPKRDIIIPVYLNQRIVYDTLAIINDGFTELYNITNANANLENTSSQVSAKVETNGNPLTFMKASVASDIDKQSSVGRNDKNEFQKVHTPTSLFSKVYEYIKEDEDFKIIKTEDDLDKVNCGDFVEFKSFLKIKTLEEGFRDMEKMAQISEMFLNFGNDKDSKDSKKSISALKKNMNDLTTFLDLQNQKTKYMVGKIGIKDIVIKIDRDCIIDADYEQLNNGTFRVIGKVLEVVPEGEKINLNRESVIGYLKDEAMKPVKTAIEAMSDTLFDYDTLQDEVVGKTIIVMPIVIGI